MTLARIRGLSDPEREGIPLWAGHRASTPSATIGVTNALELRILS